ncbi:MAG: AAA family ATPase [Planctomycetota bacterium]
MLRELIITNLLIVDRASLNPGEGLAVISGETGAGKSLLLDALELVAGGRASADVIGPASDTCELAADFSVSTARAVQVRERCGVADSDGAFIIRRRIRRDGRGQAWINDIPVTVTALRAASSELVEIHAQDQARRLADPAQQLAAIDSHGGLGAQATAYTEVHRRVLDLESTARALSEGDRGSARELEFLRFQRQEFAELGPKPGELSELEARHQLLSQAEAWRTLCAEATAALCDDDRSATRITGRFARRLADAPSASLREAGAQLTAAVEMLQAASAACASAADGITADPTELATLSERIDAYNSLIRKHGGNEQALFVALADIDRRIAELDGLDGRRATIDAELATAKQQRERSGRALASARREAFQRLATEVHRHLVDLGMPKARIELHDNPTAGPSSLGLIGMELHVKTNPGMPAGPLRDVASGGETSRLMLALAASLAEDSGAPLLVFDEVDAGVGGRLGAAIGGKLAQLARGRTVLAVTHTPQVAARAQTHFMVKKRQGRQQTTVEVTSLTGEARLSEIAEMLGGGPAARAQAKSLCAGASA